MSHISGLASSIQRYNLMINLLFNKYMLMKYPLAALVILALTLPAFSAEKDYTEFVNTIKDKIGQAPWKGASYERLAYIVDTYGPRM